MNFLFEISSLLTKFGELDELGLLCTLIKAIIPLKNYHNSRLISFIDSTKITVPVIAISQRNTFHKIMGNSRNI